MPSKAVSVVMRCRARPIITIERTPRRRNGVDFASSARDALIVNCERTDRRTDGRRSTNLPAVHAVARSPVCRAARDLATARVGRPRASALSVSDKATPAGRGPAGLAGSLPGRQVAVISRVQTAARRAAPTLRSSSPGDWFMICRANCDDDGERTIVDRRLPHRPSSSDRPDREHAPPWHAACTRRRRAVDFVRPRHVHTLRYCLRNHAAWRHVL